MCFGCVNIRSTDTYSGYGKAKHQHVYIRIYKRIHEFHACDALAGIPAIIELRTRAIFSINTEKSTDAPLALAALYTIDGWTLFLIATLPDHQH